MSSLRLRFSIRWLLIAFTVATVVFYMLWVRPTQIAHRFVRAIEAGNYQLAASLLKNGDVYSITSNYSEAVCQPQISQRTWADTWHMRRSITVWANVAMKYHNKRTGATDFKPSHQQTSLFESGPFRVRLIDTKSMEIW
jgi:hypothetical protein